MLIHRKYFVFFTNKKKNKDFTIKSYSKRILFLKDAIGVMNLYSTTSEPIN